MAIGEILGAAESEASAEVERLRGLVVLQVLSSTTFRGPLGSSLQTRVQRTVTEFFLSINQHFYRFVDEAWEAGLQRAGHSEVPRAIWPGTDQFVGAMERSFATLSASVVEDLTLLFISASTAKLDKAVVIDRIGSAPQSGLFRGYDQRALGIVNWGLKAAEARAYALRSREIAKVRAQQSGLTEAKKLIEGHKYFLTMKVFSHSGHGNPPRANHVAMDRKGVPIDMKFILEGRKAGITYEIDGPHDITLPAEELINCHCATETIVFEVTKPEEDAIREEAAKTGGYRDKRWS